MKEQVKISMQFFAQTQSDGTSTAETESVTDVNTEVADTAGVDFAEDTLDSDNPSDRDAESDENSSDKENTDENNSDEITNGESDSDRKATGDITLNLLESLRDSIFAQLQDAEIEEVIKAWECEEEKTREVYPDFSLKNEILNEPLFGELLKCGISVRCAYECIHLKEIIGSAVRYAVAETGRKTAGAMHGASIRPGENSVLDRASSVMHTDVKSLTEKDIMRILSEVSKGAKISFG